MLISKGSSNHTGQGVRWLHPFTVIHSFFFVDWKFNYFVLLWFRRNRYGTKGMCHFIGYEVQVYNLIASRKLRQIFFLFAFAFASQQTASVNKLLQFFFPCFWLSLSFSRSFAFSHWCLIWFMRLIIMIDIKHGFCFNICPLLGGRCLWMMLLMFAEWMQYNIKLTNATQTYPKQTSNSMVKFTHMFFGQNYGIDENWLLQIEKFMSKSLVSICSFDNWNESKKTRI